MRYKMSKQSLPEDFFWGNSTSSMQTEGAVHEGGKGPSVYDTYRNNDGTSVWDNAIDEYHRYQEDLDLMAKQGINCYRFQISWSRVNPTGDGDFNQEGIDFYSHLIDELLKRQIEPIICLYHFDMPLALAKKYNGFLSRHVVDAFVRYGKKMIDLFGDRVKYWLTFNEQNLYFMPGAYKIAGCIKGEETLTGIYQISHYVMLAHARIANYLHKNTTCQIGGMLAYSEVYPVSSIPQDIQCARQIDEFLNKNLLDVFVYGHYSNEVVAFVKNHHLKLDVLAADLDEISNTRSDYFAFSYYQSATISSSLVPAEAAPNYYLTYGGKENPFLPVNEWGWSIDPSGFRDILTKTYNQYQIPLFPVENGIGLREKYSGSEIIDDQRIAYHREHLKALKKAMLVDGVPIIGYLVWGLIDIPSSSGNIDKRYGMVYVSHTDRKSSNLKRIPKKSYWWFQKAIKTNGDNLD